MGERNGHPPAEMNREDERTLQAKGSSNGIDSLSGIADCPGSMTYSQLIEMAESSGWCTDGLHPEAEGATIAALLERVQPRPLHWECGLLAGRCRRIIARRTDGGWYTSTVSPRKASGPDLAFLFISGEGRFGTIERASLALVRPAPRYLLAEGTFEDLADAFDALQQASLIDPLSVRRLEDEGRRVVLYFPLRTAEPDALEALLKERPLEMQPVSSIPRSARIAAALPDGATLRVSAGYGTVIEVVRDARENQGRRRLEVGFAYPDSHGLMATLTMAKSNRDYLETVRQKTMTRRDVYLAEWMGEAIPDERVEATFAPVDGGGRR